MANVVVTGANRGIGLQLATQFKERGDTVIATSRSPSSALQALGVHTEILDVTDADSVASFADRMQNTSIDLLVNNAGLLSREALDDLDLNRVRRQFEVNALGPLRVTAALRDQLADGAKVAIVTSRMGSVADNTSGGMYGYRMSKAAVNMAGKSLAIDLAPKKVAVVLLHPGYVRTEMTGNNGLIDPPEAAAGMIARIDAVDADTSGTFWHSNGDALPW